MRKLSLLLALVFMVTLTARAQDTTKVEVFGGYQYLRVNPNVSGVSSFNLNGWDASVEVKPWRWLGVVGDFGGAYGSPFGVSSNVYTFLFGPQISMPGRISPFFHVLAGAARAGASGTTSRTEFGAQFGGGVDFRIAHGFAFRAIQIDDVLTHFNSVNQNNLKIATGVVFRF